MACVPGIPVEPMFESPALSKCFLILLCRCLRSAMLEVRRRGGAQRGAVRVPGAQEERNIKQERGDERKEEQSTTRKERTGREGTKTVSKVGGARVLGMRGQGARGLRVSGELFEGLSRMRGRL